MAQLAQPKTLRAQESRLRLCLLGDWRLEKDGTPISLLHKERQLIALLALQGSRQRSYIAGLFWQEVDEARARGSLRQVIAGVRRAMPEALVATGDSLSLNPAIRTDVDTVREWCRRVHAPGSTFRSKDAAEALAALGGPELLVGEFDDWVLVERERLQRNRLLALEMLGRRLSDLNEVPYAVAACEYAADLEPLREGPVRTLMHIHLKHGNRVDAQHAFDSFSRRLRSYLDADPSPELAALLQA